MREERKRKRERENIEWKETSEREKERA